MSEWIGKAVSIHLARDLGIWQGEIKNVQSSFITISRPFRNGLPIGLLKGGFSQINIS